MRRIAVVTNYPPDRRPLSEYALHLVRYLRETNPRAEVLVLGGRLETAPEDEFVHRVWTYGKPTIPWEIVRSLDRLSVDGVIFNTHFTMWGSHVANFAGLTTPWILARDGMPVVVLLHNLPWTVNAARLGYRFTSIHRTAVDLVCRTIARAGTVCFTLTRDLKDFLTRYQPLRALHVPHGLLGEPDWSVLPSGEARILAFGNWGRGKQLEPLILAFLQRPVGTLVVAGQSSHTRPGYLEAIERKYSCRNVVFAGYTPEECVARLFQSVSLVVLPYSENTGCSGVLVQACQYARPVLVRRSKVFDEIARELRLSLFVYDDEDELPALLPRLMSETRMLQRSARHNFLRVQEWSMGRVAELYWELLGEAGGRVGAIPHQQSTLELPARLTV